MDLEAELTKLAEAGAVVLATARGGWKCADAPGDLLWTIEPGHPRPETYRYATGRTPTGALRALLAGVPDEDQL